jgi:hypothetical protein
MYWLAWIGKAKVWPVNTNLVGTVTMKCLLGSACIYFVLIASGSAETVDQRDFSVDTFQPTPNEVRLAEKRVHAYWIKHQAEYATNTRYLAVEAAAIFPAEVQDLWPKLINSETATDFFAHGSRFTYSNLNLTGILIYDTLNNRFIDRGFVSVDLPRRNRLARWERYVARFIGTGWG